eukprot:TRINITY_DN454_c0_g1_i13.p1 TRINITY_DN454_c0_g1~~TRINITY_DN454_c0_g1_i13.p1  ORF type:complete len:165 (-),score=50.97 TRINITY_DN454_c0_g1_i13:146-640(-)
MGCTSSNAAKAKAPVASDSNLLQSEQVAVACPEKAAPAGEAAPASASADPATAKAETKKKESADTEDVKVDKEKAAKDPAVAEAQENPAVAEVEPTAESTTTAAGEAGAEKAEPQLSAMKELPASASDQQNGQDDVAQYESVALPSIQVSPAPAQATCNVFCCA